MAREHVQIDDQPLKKVKTRKGTFSCWECKRRKKRCIIPPNSAAGICKSCERLGYRCIGQECPEESLAQVSAAQKRMRHIETLAASLVDQRRQRSQALGRVPQPCSGSPLNSLTGAGEDRISRCRSLSGYFYSVLPHPFIADLMAKHGKAAFEGLREPLRLSKTSLCMPENFYAPVDVQAAYLARKLIRLAVSLMYMDATSSHQVADLQLGAPAMETAGRYVAAAQHLTSEPQLLESSAGLECVMMMGHYYIHLGRISEGGTSFHRALHLAQRIELPKRAAIGNDEGKAAASACFRLISANRSLSLHSGGSCDDLDEDSIQQPGKVGDEVREHLYRINVRMWRRLIHRNLRLRRAWGCDSIREAALDIELGETLSIDQEMKCAMLFVPPAWWNLPDLSASEPEATAEGSFSRLNTSKDHYYTIVLAHLPYVLQASTTLFGSSFAYSRSAAVSASREVLLRFPVYQQYKHVPASYRAIEHKAFISGIVLLLAHMHSRQSLDFDAIDHERPKDLNALLGTIDSMEKLFARDANNPGSECASTLRRLMQAEQEMACGVAHSVTCFYGTASFSNGLEHTNIFDIELPYFGTLRIERLYPRDGSFVATNSLTLPMTPMLLR